MDRQLVADAEHDGLVDAGVGVTILCAVVAVLRSCVACTCRRRGGLVEGCEHVVTVHDGHEAVVEVEVESEVVPLVADTDDEAYIEAAEVLEGGTVVLSASDVGVVVVGALRHTGCDLTVPDAPEETDIESGADEEVEVILGRQGRNLIFETCDDGNLGIPVVVVALTDGLHIDEDLLEVGAAAHDVESRLQIDILRPWVFPFCEHIVDIAADAETEDGCVGQQVVGDIGGAVGDTSAIMHKLGFGGKVERQNESDDCKNLLHLRW